MGHQDMTGYSSQFTIGRRGFLAGTAAVLGLNGLPLPARAQPQRGGTFIMSVNQGGASDTLNPADASGSQQIVLGWAVRNNLTEIGKDNALQPELAESWSSDDAQTWVFNLRRGVTFHNGKSFGPDDVIASLNLHRGESTTSGGAPLIAAITDIVAEGDAAVRITLDAPNADFPFILSDYHFQMCPANADGTADVSGVGTGGYVLQDFNPGVRTVLSRNPEYWKEGAAHFDAVEVLLITDPGAATTALVTGEVHAVQQLDRQTISMLRRDPALAVESVPGGWHPTIAVQSGAAPFDDRDVRLAMKYAINRQEMVDRILRGEGVVANDQPIAPTMPYHDASIEQRPYDPDRAAFHLREAGLDRLQIQISGADSLFAGAVDMLVLYREQAMPSGIEIEVVREPAEGYWSDVWMRKPAFVGSWGARPVPDMIFSTAYAVGAPWNESQFENERFMTLLVEARSELDEARRGELYGEMQRLVSDEGGSVIPFFRNLVFGRRTEIGREEQIASNWDLDGFKAIERWWMA